MALQLTERNWLPRRLLCSWMARATTPLPVPLSPVIRTVLSTVATLLASRSTSSIAGELNRYSFGARSSMTLRNTRFSSLSLRRVSMLDSRFRTSSLRTGLMM